MSPAGAAAHERRERTVSAGSGSPGVAGTPATPMAVSHVALVTADLDRCRAFYEDVIGLRTAIVLRMAGPPGLRHALLSVSDTTALHVVERPGYDPATEGIPNEIGRRGRLDHLGFLMADVAELEAVRDRLVAVGASEGVVTSLGPMLSVHFRDPDGFEGEINAPNPVFDAGFGFEGHDTVEEEPDPTLYARLVAACARSRLPATT